MLRIVAVTSLIIGASVGVARADVYRWVDEHHVAHYSDQWVPGSEVIKTTKSSRQLRQSNPDATQAAQQNKFAAASAQISSQLAEKAAQDAVKKDVAKAREEQCKKARESYEQAIQARRIYKQKGKDGERDYMSDEEADAYRLQARNQVQETCGKPPAPAQ
jgi:Domain of unknown function (DUF4124)